MYAGWVCVASRSRKSKTSGQLWWRWKCPKQIMNSSLFSKEKHWCHKCEDCFDKSRRVFCCLVLGQTNQRQLPQSWNRALNSGVLTLWQVSCLRRGKAWMWCWRGQLWEALPNRSKSANIDQCIRLKWRAIGQRKAGETKSSESRKASGKQGNRQSGGRDC